MTTKTYTDLLGREIIEGDLAGSEETDRHQRYTHATLSTMMQLQHSEELHKERENRRNTIGECKEIYCISPLTKALLGIAFTSLANAIIGRYLLIVFGITRPSWMWAVGAIVGLFSLLIQAGLNLLD